MLAKTDILCYDETWACYWFIFVNYSMSENLQKINSGLNQK